MSPKTRDSGSRRPASVGVVALLALALVTAGCTLPARPRPNTPTEPLPALDEPPLVPPTPLPVECPTNVTAPVPGVSVKPRVLGDPCTSGLEKWPGSFESPITTFDFNADGVGEVVAPSTDGKVYVYHALTGRALAEFAVAEPPKGGKTILPGVAVAVLRPGEPATIVAAHPGAVVSAWEFVPSRSTADVFKFVKRWEQAMPIYSEGPSMRAAPVLGDIDGDGKLEIVVQTYEVGVHALRADGAFQWKLDLPGGPAAPVVGDVNGDGKNEVVVGSRTGRLTVLNGGNGTTRWSFDAKALVPPPASIMAAATIARLGKGAEAPIAVLFTTRDAHDAADFATNHFTAFALREEKAKPVVMWQSKMWWGAPMVGAPLAVADVDGDNIPEVLGADWNTLGETPGNWATVGVVHVFALNPDGTERWVRQVGTWWGDKGVAVGDFDHDGRVEVLANGPRGPDDGVWMLNGANGVPERHLAIGEWQARRGGPLAATLLGEGTVQVLVPSGASVAGQERGAVLLFDLGTTGPVGWPGG